jgi:hypothetical protein
MATSTEWGAIGRSERDGELETASHVEFKVQWLESIREGSPSPRKLGRRLAHKLLRQSLGTSLSSPNYRTVLRITHAPMAMALTGPSASKLVVRAIAA